MFWFFKVSPEYEKAIFDKLWFWYNCLYHRIVTDQDLWMKQKILIFMHIKVDLSLSLINVSLETPSKHSGDQFNPIISVINTLCVLYS